jgi:hypothetical protein
MSYLAIFGFGGAGDSQQTIDDGKRRSVLILSIIAAALFAVACDAPTSPMPWVTGSIEFDPLTSKIEDFTSMPGCPPDVDFDGEKPKSMLGATFQIDFHLGLTTFGRDDNFNMPNSGVPAQRWCYNAIGDTVTDINSAIAQNRGLWRGANPLTLSTFVDTQAAIAAATAFAWMLVIQIVLMMYDAPVIGSHKYLFETLKALPVLTSLCGTIGLGIYANAGIKNEFCSVFDPDANNNAQFSCGYTVGYNCAVAALVFAIVISILNFVWLPQTLGVKYSFSSNQSGFEPAVDTSAFKTAAYTSSPVAASSGFGSSSYASSYQDVGTT